MESVLVLLVAAGIAASVVWWASAASPPRPRVARARRARGPRPFELPPPKPAPEPVEEKFVLVESTVPDERPSPVLAVLRLAVTIAAVAAVGVALLAALWLVVNSQLSGYLAR